MWPLSVQRWNGSPNPNPDPNPNPNLHPVFTDKGLTDVLVDVVKSLSLKIDDDDIQWR